MVNKSRNATGSADTDAAKDSQPALTREERLGLELRRNLLKRKAQSRGRSESQPSGDDEDSGPGA